MWVLKPSVALRKYCWVIVRSIAYGDKNKLQFAPQACVLMDNFSDSMEAVYAVTLVPSINAGMLGKRGGCRGSSAVHWGPATAKSPKSERDAEQEVWNSQRSERCSVWVRVASDCPRYRDPSVYSCITLEVVGPGLREAAERLPGGQPESPPSIYVPGFLFISFNTEKEGLFLCSLQ